MFFIKNALLFPFKGVTELSYFSLLRTALSKCHYALYKPTGTQLAGDKSESLI